jgi:Protein of unknown function (DUF5818)
MKIRFARVLLVLSSGLLALQLGTAQVNKGSQRVFSGEITDTFCAKNKSHDQMMSEMKSMGTEKQTCAQKCVQIGAKYVLLDTAKGPVYSLDDQAKAAAFAGREVRIVGTLENNELKIASINAGSSAIASGQ